MKTLTKIFISLFIAIIGGAVSLWIPDISNIFSLILTLLFFIVSTLILEVTAISKRLDELEKSNYILFQTINNLFKNETTFSDFYNITLYSFLRKGIKDRKLIIQRENAPLFWLKTLMHFDKSFFATSYIDVSEGWTLAYTNLALEIQEANVKQGKPIKRVFIVGSDAELPQVMQTIKKQREKGIDARYIFLKKLKEHRVMNTVKLETLDFCLIDNEFLSLIILDKNRRISCLRLIRDRQLYEKYNNFYTHLSNEAEIPE